MKTILSLIALSLFVSSAYALPECVGNTRFWQDCEGKEILSNGDEYVGEWSGGQRHGYGTYTSSTGNKYVGEWKDGNVNGWGTQTYQNGNEYVGDWLDGKKHGYGTFHQTDGIEYVGEWRNGKRNGLGKVTYDLDSFYPGDELIGVFSEDVLLRGVYRFANGAEYVGEFKNMNKHGLGVYTHEDGSFYMGEWQNNQQYGQGINIGKDGSKYVGGFRFAKFHGQGTVYPPVSVRAEWIAITGEYTRGNRRWPHIFIFPGGRVELGRIQNNKYVRDLQAEQQDENFKKRRHGIESELEASERRLTEAVTQLYKTIQEEVKDQALEQQKQIEIKRNRTERLAESRETDEPSDLEKQRRAEEQRKADQIAIEEARKEEEQRRAEEQRKADQIAIEEARKEEQQRRADRDDELLQASSELPPCPAELEARWHNCQGIKIFEKNAHKYEGEWRDGKMHGQGTFTYGPKSQFPGDKYVGEYRDGKRNGQGTYTFADDGQYVGEFRDNKMHGQGTLTWLDGAQYIGEFRDGERNGQGIATYASGDKYVGEWKDGNKHGQGTYTWVEGDKYVGEYRDGKQHGQGTYTFTNGSKYVGEHRDDKRRGQGTFTWANGDKHVGEFRDDKRNGQGTFTFADGEYGFHSVIGEWKDDEPVWPATFIYPGGRWEMGRLEGTEVIRDYAAEEQRRADRDDELLQASSELPQCPAELEARWHNCQGTYTLENGDKYVGEWKDNTQHGQGIATFANGNKYVGEVRDGKKYGQGTFTWASGDKYVGEWKDDKQHGQGTYTWADGEKYVGEYSDGKQHGQGAYTSANGNKYVGEFRDDKRNGQGTFTFADGEYAFHAAIGEFRDDEPVWPHTFIYPGGRWEMGRLEGTEVIRDYAAEEQRRAQGQRRAESDELLQASSGSGFAVSRDGYVVTNNHVINGCQNVAIHNKGVAVPVTIVAYDTQNDLALLKGDFSPGHVFPIRRDNPGLLEDVYVAGFPFGEGYSSSIKVTKGIVSALTGIGNNFSEIQIDAALQPGNSGGPILDEFGNVMAVAVAKLDVKFAIDNFGAIPENINFGIKSNVVRSILESQSVGMIQEAESVANKRQLGEQITKGTYYISCWMTTAQIQDMKDKKVMFESIK